MRRRPQRNPRRGILRAIAAVVALVLLLLAAILITSSLTAPPATAPTVPTAPPTPGPATAAPRGTPTSQRGAATPTPSKKKRAAAGVFGGSQSGVVHDHAARSQLQFAALAEQPVSGTNEVVTRDGRRAAYFMQVGDAYSRNPLMIEQRSTHQRKQMGYGDPLVRPVWSANGRYLLYVRVEDTKALPYARWSLVRLDTASQTNVVLDKETSRALVPVGWSRGKLLFLVVSSTDTGLYTIVSGHSRFVGIFMPQAITSALLSPDGRYIAFAAPTSCMYCTLDFYDVEQAAISNGPSGLPNELAMTWTQDGSRLVAQMHNRLALVTPASLSTQLIRAPVGLPILSLHPMRASISGRTLRLVDLATGRVYRSTY